MTKKTETVLKPQDYSHLVKFIKDFLDERGLTYDWYEDDSPFCTGRFRFTLNNIVDPTAEDEDGDNPTDCGYDLAIEVLAVER